MQTKPCSVCGSHAALSLCYILSTIGRSPRKQQCSSTTPLCFACLQRLAATIGTLGPSSPQKPLVDAYTALAARLVDTSTPANGPTIQFSGESGAAHCSELQAVSNSLQL